MRSILILLIVTSPIITVGQIDFENPPWNIGCDSASTQLQMNTCNYKSYTIADSMLTHAYETIIHELDYKYDTEKKRTLPSKKKTQLTLLHKIKNQKASVINSRDQFMKMRESMISIIGPQHEGGSIQSLVINTYALELTVNQLTTPDSMLKELTE